MLTTSEHYCPKQDESTRARMNKHTERVTGVVLLCDNKKRHLYNYNTTRTQVRPPMEPVEVVLFETWS